MNQGKLEMTHCPSESHVADILTKELKIEIFFILMQNLGVMQFVN